MNTPPAIEVSAGVCPDAARAKAWVRESMQGSKAPEEGWKLIVKTDEAARVVGVLEDGAGHAVAHRNLYQHNDECESSMHALGVWASLVLDAEVNRAEEHERLLRAQRQIAALDDAREPDITPVHHAAEAPRKPAPRALEVGVSTLLEGGASGGNTAHSPTYIGGAAFASAEVVTGVTVRPAVSYARTIERPQPIDTARVRLDACLRVPHEYVDRRGITLDACLGPEFGVAAIRDTPKALGADALSAHTAVLVGMGPAVGIRGDIANSLAVEFRASGLIDFITGQTGDPFPPVSLRAELGFSWGLR